MGFNLPIMNRRRRGRLDAYREGGANPALVLDFDSEYYRTGGAQTTFDSALTATRAGNATMVDSDGKIKWAPHNLVSSSTTTTGWAGFGTSVSVSSGVYTMTENSGTSEHNGGIAFSTAYQTDLVVDVKANGRTKGGFDAGTASATYRANFDLITETIDTAGSAITSSSITPLGDGWYRLTVRATNTNTFRLVLKNDAGAVSYTGDGVSGFLFRYPHAYRSDLGGMVAVPADARATPSATTYVPTTSAARYLPRRGHHVYNGSEWVNEGLLVESEARTNLVTYSGASTANWLTSGATLTQLSGSYLGAFAGVRVTSTGADWNRLETSDLSWTSGQTYNLTFFYVAGTSGRARLNLRDNTAGTESRANGPIGAVVAGTVNAGAVTNVTTETLPGGVYKTTYTFVPNNTTNLGRVGIGPDSTTAGQDIIALGAQFEAGSTPSSYIPTAGATVTRAAETLVIPSANLPWPAPQYVTGTELVTNGTFDTDISGWSNGSDPGGAIAWNPSGYLDLVNTSGTVRSGQTLNFVAGKVYRIGVTVVSVGGAASAALYFDNTSLLSFPVVGVGTHYVYFVAPSGPANINGRNFTTGTTVTLDNISVKEINPLSVSIAMDGRMTYADADSFSTSFHVRWYKDSNNYIYSTVDTAGTFTGRPKIHQAALGVVDSVTGSTVAYTPGVNVPFNIAARHGSTFINGAVDGVALTADLTPVALPDLSATNLQLGYDFMGTIGSFRIWADDIGDAGLVTATNPSTEPSLLLTFDSAETSFVDLGWSE